MCGFQSIRLLVGALVAGRVDKLVNQVSVRPVDFDTVETNFNGILGGLRKVLDDVLDLLLGQFHGRLVIIANHVLAPDGNGRG